MLVIGAILYLVLAFTVLMLVADFSAGAAFLIPLVGLAAGWWPFAPRRRT